MLTDLKDRFFDSAFMRSKPEAQKEAAYEHITAIFQALKLTVPEKHDFFHGNGNIGIIPLHRAGLMVRIVPEDEFTLIRQRHVMRPIGSIRLAYGHRMDFQFTGRCPVTEDDAVKCEDDMEADNVYHFDFKADNMCYLPISDERYPNGIPVDFDPQGLEFSALKTRKLSVGYSEDVIDRAPNMYSSSDIYDLSPQQDEKPDEQDIAYCDLRHQFREMFDLDACIGKIVVDPEAVDTFWRAAIRAKDLGRLNPSWMDNVEGSEAQEKGISTISAHYDERVRAVNPVFEAHSQNPRSCAKDRENTPTHAAEPAEEILTL